MLVKIKRIDASIPAPKYHTNGSAAFDFCSRETLTIAPHGLMRIPTGLIIATPEGYVLVVSARSSLAIKKGLMLANGIGLVDSDYCGPNDEILISVYNLTNQEITIEKGDRLAQGMFLKVERAQWEEVTAMEAADRGGFGSTDK